MKTCFVDSRISEEELDTLSKEISNIIKVPKSPYLYDSISAHPDIQVNIISNTKIIIASNSLLDISSNSLNNISILKSEKLLKDKYPENIFLNAVNLKDFFIHNLKYTDKVLLDEIKNKNLINIKQGYAKCSTAIVNDNALITSDVGIYKSLKPYPIDVLLIASGDINLPGLPYGFIGGSCGLIAKDKLAFFGNLKFHNYKDEIEKFLYKHNVEPIYLSNSSLIDRGSILSIY